MRLKRPAFTLIELLVVIAIIGVLATISIIALSNARAKARDAKRVGDIKQIQTALELFFNDAGKYPDSLDFGRALYFFSSSSNSTTTYMNIVPLAPAPADGNCSAGDNNYSYTQTDDGQDYVINFCLGGQSGILDSGDKCARSSGVIDQNCCGLYTVKYDGGPYDSNGLSQNSGGYYRTVVIGDQCWLKDNINAGGRISSCNVGDCAVGVDCDSSCASRGGVKHQADADNGVFQKYCKNDLDVNCSVLGGFYQWHTAMGLPASYDSNNLVVAANYQGICPEGWHIPNHDEWHALELLFASSPSVCNLNHTSGDCAPAGDKIKMPDYTTSAYSTPDNASGFSAVNSGFRISGGQFFNNYAYFWMTEHGPTWSYSELLKSDWPNTYFEPATDKINGFSVRCIKN
jgi:general secretion pathway protein G